MLSGVVGVFGVLVQQLVVMECVGERVTVNGETALGTTLIHQFVIMDSALWRMQVGEVGVIGPFALKVVGRVSEEE